MRTPRLAAMLLASAALPLGIAACGGGGSVSPGLTPISTTAPVSTATPASGTPTPSATLTPLVQPTVGSGGGGTPAPVLTPAASPSSTATLSPQGTPLPAGEKVYVLNHDTPKGNISASNAQNPSVTIYPVAASGNATPLATLIGPSTGLDEAQFLTVDANGTVYVTNQGTDLAGSITVYPAVDGFSGNVAPAVTVTGVNVPTGICVDDAHGYVFVLTYFQINVYKLYANGALTLDHTIAGTTPGSLNTTLNEPQIFGDYSCAVNDGYVFIAGSTQWLAFKTTDSGNVAPTFNYGGAASLLLSTLGIAADASGDVYLTSINGNMVDSFSAPATTATPAANATAPASTDTPPTSTTISTAFNEPIGAFIDTSGQFFVTNIGTNSVDVFSSTTVLLTGTPTATISGASTGLNRPYGVYAR